MNRVELVVDVTEAAGLGEPASVALTVHLPESSGVSAMPVVCFAKPGGGYSKGYYTEDLPGPSSSSGSQARWHANRGWVFVSIDHLGVGASSTDHDAARLDFTTVAAANQAGEREVLRRLTNGTLLAGYPPISEPLVLGIGQSMGGCMTIIQQGRYHCYDGIGVLGYSAVHTHPQVRQGDLPIVAPWLPRDTLLTEPVVVVNTPQMVAAGPASFAAGRGLDMAWCFYYDDVDLEIVRADLEDFPMRLGELPPWASATVPGAVGAASLTPGTVAPEAAAVLVPVLVAMGERDTIADPKGEPRAYQSATSVDLFICPHAGHMHNFASTRELLWRRLDTWASWVRTVKESNLL
jgi:alpha-beta hydrolase superfamily lysophospholipase